jgi:hypothetical protein
LLAAPAQIPARGTTAPPLALSHAIIAVGSYNTVLQHRLDLDRRHHPSTSPVAVLQLEATPAATHRRYMALAG